MLTWISTLITRILRQHHKDDDLSENDILKIETKLNYQSKNKTLIIQALKHRSFLSVSNEARLLSNERLELLGDSVLGMVVTEFLYTEFPTKEEGELTTIKSLLVSRKILARIARQIGIGELILLNDAEEKAG